MYTREQKKKRPTLNLCAKTRAILASNAIGRVIYKHQILGRARNTPGSPRPRGKKDVIIPQDTNLTPQSQPNSYPRICPLCAKQKYSNTTPYNALQEKPGALSDRPPAPCNEPTRAKSDIFYFRYLSFLAARETVVPFFNASSKYGPLFILCYAVF